jgi:predicted site-specific integrase-resolvase
MPTTKPQTTSAEQQYAELLNQNQMAQRLGISRRTLHNWVRDGAVPMIKLKGFCRFEPEKVFAAIMQKELPAKDKAKAKRKEVIK